MINLYESLTIIRAVFIFDIYNLYKISRKIKIIFILRWKRIIYFSLNALTLLPIYLIQSYTLKKEYNYLGLDNIIRT